MRACNDAANLAMGPGNDAARLLTPSVSQDQRKCLLLRSQQARKVVLMSSDAQPWQRVSLHACYWSYSIWACFIQ